MSETVGETDTPIPTAGRRNFWKWLGGIIGVLLLGGLGNGVWEALMRPSLSWFLNGILSVLSWGIQSQKDDVYARVASGFHEGPAATTEILVITIIGFATYALGLLQYVLSLRDPDKPPGWIRWLAGYDEQGRTTARHRWNTRIAIAATAIGVATLAITGLKDAYVHLAVKHYTQCRQIIAPRVTPTFLTERDSEFARIRTRQDYVQVIHQLEKVANDNNYPLPRFSPW